MHSSILTLYSQIQISGNSYAFCPEILVEAQVLELFYAKYATMYYVLIKGYFFLENLLFLYVPIINCTMKL